MKKIYKFIVREMICFLLSMWSMVFASDDNLSSLLDQPIVEKHYRNVGEKYDKLWEYEESYSKQLIKDIEIALEIKEGDVVADLGGGTGIWAEKISKIRGVSSVFCVEPIKEMVARSRKKKGILPRHQSVLSFLEGTQEGSVQKFIAKSCFHHFDNRKTFFRELHRILPNGGRFLIITSSDNCQSFPFFEDVITYLKRQSSSFNSLFNECKNENELFETVIEEKHYKTEINQEIWFDMIRGRFISTLSKFSDAEIEKGIEELSATIPNNLSFNVNYYFITLKKI